MVGRGARAAAALWLAAGGGARGAADRLLARGPVGRGDRARAGRRRCRVPRHTRPAQGARHSHRARRQDEGRRDRPPRPRRSSRLGPQRRSAHQPCRRGLHHAVGADAGARGRCNAGRLWRDDCRRPATGSPPPSRICAAGAWRRSRSCPTAWVRRWPTRIWRDRMRCPSMPGRRWGCWSRSPSPPKEPVLDVVAGNDFDEVNAAAPLRKPKLPHDGCSRDVTIDGHRPLLRQPPEGARRGHRGVSGSGVRRALQQDVARRNANPGRHPRRGSPA